jgi:hypothetical protein
VIGAVCSYLRHASPLDALTAHYDKPPKLGAVEAALLDARRSRARLARERRCLPSPDASGSSNALTLGVSERGEVGPVGEEESVEESVEESAAQQAACNRHRARNLAAAVKAVSETMQPTLLWTSGVLRSRLVQMQAPNEPAIDWMGECIPRAPASVWPGAFAWHGEGGREDPMDVSFVGGRSARALDPGRARRRMGPALVEAGAGATGTAAGPGADHIAATDGGAARYCAAVGAAAPTGTRRGGS